MLIPYFFCICTVSATRRRKWGKVSLNFLLYFNCPIKYQLSRIYAAFRVGLVRMCLTLGKEGVWRNISYFRG